MKAKLILAVLALSTVLALQSCQSTTPGSSSAPAIAPPTAAQITADAAIGLNVAAQYEAIAKVRKVTPADYVTLAAGAANQYAATQPAATAAQIQQWTALATTAAQVYDLAKGGK